MGTGSKRKKSVLTEIKVGSLYKRKKDTKDDTKDYFFVTELHKFEYNENASFDASVSYYEITNPEKIINSNLGYAMRNWVEV